MGVVEVVLAPEPKRAVVVVVARCQAVLTDREVFQLS
jgi:RecB family endonuclease NucS